MKKPPMKKQPMKKPPMKKPEKKSAAKSEPFCIVRCRNAGVHAGYLVSRNAEIVVLRDSRRLWRWWSAATLSELSQEGPVKPEENRYGCVLPRLELTSSDVCEIIPCTALAAAAIGAVRVWRA